MALRLAPAVLLALGTASPAAAGDAVARGAYLAAAAGCEGCHTDPKGSGKPYAGGRSLDTAFGSIATPNITPDIATGIGGWSMDDFTRAMRWGIAPDGSHYVPAFPFPYFAGLTDGDLADLKAFLDSVPPVSRPAAGPSPLALVQRARAALGVALASPPSPPAALGSDPAAARGAYLVETVGHCGGCHTPLTWLGAPDEERHLAGSHGGVEGEKAPNITPDAATGIGRWSADEIATTLKTGETPEFDVLGGAMREIVRNAARLTDDDRRAIAAYLKTVPAKSFADKE